MTDIDKSPAYQRFLDFFTLTQRARLEGLDAGYFSEMTDEEKDLAFAHLKNKPDFEFYPERLRGLYLCNTEKSIALFKEILKTDIPIYEMQQDNDLVLHGRVFMSGYVCNIEPTKENINNLISLDVSKSNEDVRNLKYQLIPISPTTTEAVNYLKEAAIIETATLPAASSISALMSMYGLKFDINDENYLKIYRGLRSSEKEEKLAAIKKLDNFKAPVIVV